MSKLKTKKYNAVANAEKDASQTFVKGAAILTLSMVIVKVFGLLDKVILTGIFSGVSFEQAVAGGTETVNFASFGLGLYSNAYEIFVVIFTAIIIPRPRICGRNGRPDCEGTNSWKLT